MRQIGQRTGRSSRSSLATFGKRVASLRYLPSGLMLQLEVPFDRDFTESLKKSVQSKKRIWDGNDKCWYVCKDQFDRVCHLLDQTFDETLLLDFPAAEVSTNSWSKLWLIEGAPLEVVRASYKALAQIYHPDRGGDLGIMQTINGAYKEILGELKNGD